jgi:UPF0716 protein FxsA
MMNRGFSVWLRLVILFTVIPLIEVVIFIELGSRLGAWSVVFLILLTGLIGAWLARREGIRVLRGIQDEFTGGRVPGPELVEGSLILAGGILLLTPGFFTDLVGLGLLIPQSRRRLAGYLIQYFKARLEAGAIWFELK